MDERTDSPGEARMFSTFGANFGYWQIELDKKSIDKTASVTHRGLFKYIRMLFGLENDSATFQRAMNVLLAPVK